MCCDANKTKKQLNQQDETFTIHEGADLESVAFSVIVRALKDLHKPKFGPDYTEKDHEGYIEEILSWSTTDNFRAMCQIAGLNHKFVSLVIEKIIGLTPDMQIVNDLSSIARGAGRGFKGYDTDQEAMIWGD